MFRHVEDRSRTGYADRLDRARPAGTARARPRTRSRSPTPTGEEPVRQAEHGVLLVQHDRDVRAPSGEDRRDADVAAEADRDVRPPHERRARTSSGAATTGAFAARHRDLDGRTARRGSPSKRYPAAGTRVASWPVARSDEAHDRAVVAYQRVRRARARGRCVRPSRPPRSRRSCRRPPRRESRDRSPPLPSGASARRAGRARSGRLRPLGDRREHADGAERDDQRRPAERDERQRDARDRQQPRHRAQVHDRLQRRSTTVMPAASSRPNVSGARTAIRMPA